MTQVEMHKLVAEAKEMLKNGDYLKAAILFDKVSNAGYAVNSSDGDVLYFLAGVARQLAGDEGIAKDRFQTFFQCKQSHSNASFGDYKKDSFFWKLFLDRLPNWYLTSLQEKNGVKPNRNVKNESSDSIFGTFQNSKLEGLIGLNSVKVEVEKLFNVVKVRQMRQKRGFDVSPTTLHMVFTGNPGTGKTTVARIVAEVFKEIGLLSKGHLIEVDRGGVVGQYVGHTAPKMTSAVESALGGVLFIDEAYSLSQGGEKDFGKEAVETLVKLMEDKREDLVVIVAGYPEEMEKFLEMNPGLMSRFYKTIHFEDYNSEELTQIFMGICETKGYVYDEKVFETIKQIIEQEQLRNVKSFGNGRGVRNIFEKIEMNQANRLGKMKIEPTDEELVQFLEADVQIY